MHVIILDPVTVLSKLYITGFHKHEQFNETRIYKYNVTPYHAHSHKYIQ